MMSAFIFELINHLYIFLCEVSVQVSLIFIGLFVLWLLNCRSYIF